jgi:hypothetical protein
VRPSRRAERRRHPAAVRRALERRHRPRDCRQPFERGGQSRHSRHARTLCSMAHSARRRRWRARAAGRRARSEPVPSAASRARRALGLDAACGDNRRSEPLALSSASPPSGAATSRPGGLSCRDPPQKRPAAEATRRRSDPPQKRPAATAICRGLRRHGLAPRSGHRSGAQRPEPERVAGPVQSGARASRRGGATTWR